MRRTFALIVLLCSFVFPASAFSQSHHSSGAHSSKSHTSKKTGSTKDKKVHVRGYTRKDGTYVAPYHRTSPDYRLDNNYGSRGNMNPYTGQMGTIDPYIQPQPRLNAQPPYSQPLQKNIFEPVQPLRR